MNFGILDILRLTLYLVYVFLGYLLCLARGRYMLNMLQIEEYNNSKFAIWLKENLNKVFSFTNTTDAKTPLVMTDRAKRLYKLFLFINSVLFAGVLGLLFAKFNDLGLVIIVLVLLIALIQPLILLIANGIRSPLEKKINMGFYKSAQEKIIKYKKNGLKVVGITGSFGKTSVKFYLETILREKFKVQNSPSSYNTPMGLSKVINNDLEEESQIFIAEMGAYKPGEIDECAKLVMPDIGILTAVGPTHMQSFKTIENIQKTKYELIENLPEDGTAIFNYDNDYVKPLADKTLKKTIRYGLKDNEKLSLKAENIVLDERGSSFDLSYEGKSLPCTTKLLGEHSIQNLLGAAGAALTLGMSLEEVVNGIKKVEPVEHRLNLVEGGGNGVIVIDDAFNSNPIGFRAALKVLGAFKNGRKIIITPGMVELGDMEEEENYKIGKVMADVCDYSILVGIKRTAPIKRGLEEMGVESDKIIVVKNLNQAMSELSKITRPNDVVLFENDLPDTYEE